MAAPDPGKPLPMPEPSHRKLLIVNLSFLAVALVGALIGYFIHDWRWHPALATPQEQLALAEKAFQNSDNQVALALFTKLADKNNPDAQYWLAHMTELGLGVPREPAKAFELYKKAAAQNVVPAEARVGEIYLDGNMAPPDFAQAKIFLEKAAYHGDARAAMLLGQMYRIGLGMTADPVTAYAWSEVATLEGSTFAKRERDASLHNLSPADQQAAIGHANKILADIKRQTASPKPPNAK